MKLYNALMEKLPALTGGSAPRAVPYDPAAAWPESEEYELVLQRDMAFELGSEALGSASFLCATTDESFFHGSETVICGPDLPELKSDAPYARVALLLTQDIESDDETDTEPAYRALKAMDYVKYHVFPKGFMIRTSGQTGHEQVRVSKQALQQGLSFSRIGNTFIKRFLQDENVRAVRMVFITAPDADYAALHAMGHTAAGITASLSKILEGMPTDCSICGIREICDEVEGLRELHFGQTPESSKQKKKE